MIPFWILKNKQALMAFGAVLLLAAVWYLLMDFGHRRFLEGQVTERAVWVQAMEIAEARARNAEEALNQDRKKRESQAAERTAERVSISSQARTEIHEAPDLESRLAALNSLRRRLRDTGAENLARARADYLSTVAAPE